MQSGSLRECAVVDGTIVAADESYGLVVSMKQCDMTAKYELECAFCFMITEKSFHDVLLPPPPQTTTQESIIIIGYVHVIT